LIRPTAIPDSQKLDRPPAFDGPYEAGGIGHEFTPLLRKAILER
jgi:hypothetical protein